MTLKIKFSLLLLSVLFTAKLIAQDAIFVKKLSDTGSPMIFLPHIGCASAMWQVIADKYSKTNSCYLVDFAGFAGKPAIKDNYTENYVNGLVKYLEENNLKDCILVGQNYGAFVAGKVAAKLPGRINRMVMVDFYPKLSMVLGNDISPEKLQEIFTSIKQSTISADSISFSGYQKQMAIGMNFMDSSFVPQFVNWQMNSDKETLAGTLIEQMSADLLPYFQDNKIPTLVFSTWYFAKTFKNMPFAEAEKTMSGMYSKAQNVHHAITENAKDFIACDQPLWFTAQVDQFLK